MIFLTEQIPSFCSSLQDVCDECCCYCLDMEEDSGSIYYIPTGGGRSNSQHLNGFTRSFITRHYIWRIFATFSLQILEPYALTSLKVLGYFLKNLDFKSLSCFRFSSRRVRFHNLQRLWIFGGRKTRKFSGNRFRPLLAPLTFWQKNWIKSVEILFSELLQLLTKKFGSAPEFKFFKFLYS